MATNSGQSVSGIIYAGFWARVAAYLVDFAMIIIIGLVIGIGSAFAGEMGMMIGQIVYFFINLLYWPVMESSARQATFGKSIVGIQVTDLNGNRLSFLRALLRNLAKIISAIPLGIGYLLAAFTGRKQALHDIITKSLVVRTGPSNFFKAIAAAVGGLAIAVGGGGAYFYYVYLPQMEKGFAGAKQEAMKSPAGAKPAKPPVAQRPPTVSAVAAVSELSATKPDRPAAAAPPQPASAVPSNVATAAPSPALKPAPEPSLEPVRTGTAVRKSAPKKPRIKTPPAKPTRMNSAPGVPAKAQQITPPSPVVFPESGVAAAEARIVTPKYNDILTAVLRSDRDAVKQLLDLGRWVDKPGSSGMTPLMAAVMNRDAQMVQVLLEHGADPSAQALKLARKNKDAATVLLLEQHGAR